ncbi:MAG: bifunctional oligoribonuclease/PAP phosphatase NrnA [Anaerolineaceae bacterium]|nr:bifunctional oligoribonuclease/PAP phosphatase NrnA [Anaerolineaceae bacterium]
MMNTDQQIHAKIKKAQTIAIAAHIRPDGDAIGSVYGLGIALQEAGKSVQYLFPDGIATRFHFISGAKNFTKKLETHVDLTITVDCADLERCGGVFGDRKIDINLDHHKTNTHFAEINLVAPECAATAELLTRQMPAWGLSISQQSATALMCGILTDSQGFATNNTTSATLRYTSVLMDAGANLNDIYDKTLTEKDMKSVRLWGCGLSKIKFEGGVVWTTITQADRKETNYSGNDDADLVNFMANIADGYVYLLFNEQQNGETKISWRSKPDIDVSVLAEEYGGGGHPSAAGAEIKDSINRVEARVLERTKLFIEEYFEHVINPS